MTWAFCAVTTIIIAMETEIINFKRRGKKIQNSAPCAKAFYLIISGIYLGTTRILEIMKQLLKQLQQRVFNKNEKKVWNNVK